MVAELQINCNVRFGCGYISDMSNGGAGGIVLASLGRLRSATALLRREPENSCLLQKQPQKTPLTGGRFVAEPEGFEPSIGCPIHAFQACAIDHSATAPCEAL